MHTMKKAKTDSIPNLQSRSQCYRGAQQKNGPRFGAAAYLKV
jgi:hypothetical protein